MANIGLANNFWLVDLIFTSAFKFVLSIKRWTLPGNAHLYTQLFRQPTTGLFGNVLNQAQHVASVTVFIVVPGNQLDEAAIQRDTGFGIENR